MKFIISKIGGPRILHGVFASLTDIFLVSLTRTVIGERYVPTVVCCGHPHAGMSVNAFIAVAAHIAELALPHFIAFSVIVKLLGDITDNNCALLLPVGLRPQCSI